jgi:hypothetical protein
VLPGQLDLFGESTVPSTGIIGVRLRFASPCRCGCDVVVVGGPKGPHNAAITCSQCHKHRGWLGRTDFDRIIATISTSIRPTGPIDIGAKRASPSTR